MTNFILLFIMIVITGCGSSSAPSSSKETSEKKSVLFSNLTNTITLNKLAQNSEEELRVTHCDNGRALLESSAQKILGFYRVSGNNIIYTFDEGDVTVSSSDSAFTIDKNFDSTLQTGVITSYYLEDILFVTKASCSLNVENSFEYEMFEDKTFYVYGYFRDGTSGENRSAAIYNNTGTKVTIKDTTNGLILLNDISVSISLQNSKVFLSLNALEEGATQDYYLKTINDNIYVMESGFNPYPAVYATSIQSDNGKSLLQTLESSYNLTTNTLNKNPWYIVEFTTNSNNDMLVSCPAKTTFTSQNVQAEYINEEKQLLSFGGSYEVQNNQLIITNENSEIQTTRIIAIEDTILTFEQAKYFKNRSEAVAFAQILALIPGTDFCDKNLPQ